MTAGCVACGMTYTQILEQDARHCYQPEPEPVTERSFVDLLVEAVHDDARLMPLLSTEFQDMIAAAMAVPMAHLLPARDAMIHADSSCDVQRRPLVSERSLRQCEQSIVPAPSTTEDHV